MSGCSPFCYVVQAGAGQLALITQARPIENVIKDPATDPALALLLGRVSQVKQFAEQFGLKPTPNYTDYVQLDRDAAVYVVTVCEPLQFRVKLFSFPIVGSFNNIGWFSKKDAVAFARRFESEGMDTDVRSAAAYSTLGWFRDSILSTMIPRADGVITPDALGELVNVVLHESVHATVYIEGQSYFNESLAMFVAEHLTQKYFQVNGMLGTTQWRSYLDNMARGDELRTRLMRAYRELKEIYDSSLTVAEKSERKRLYLESLQNEIQATRPVSNATIVQYRTYDDSEHGFEELLARENGDMRLFLQEISGIKATDFGRSQDEGFNVCSMLPARSEE
jgi:predicted aminopeptidase